MERRPYRIDRPGWAWLYCRRAYPYCGHSQPVALVPYAIRWQLTDSIAILAELRRRGRCSVCGGLGVDTRLPSWGDMQIGVSSFPVDQLRR